MIDSKTIQFRESLKHLSREDLIEIIAEQNPDLIPQIQRIEWVFRNKMSHLNWSDGTPILERDLTRDELALLVDEPFEVDQELLKNGIGTEYQRQFHISKDPVVWSREFLDIQPRVYQILILRDPSLRKVLRAGRRLGKTVSLAITLLHYSYTNKDGRSLVIAPMKSQVELIYQELVKMASKNEIVKNSISRKVTSPQFMIQFSNGSTIRFFTSGIRSGGKSDVARGQEAHLIILDEMDYMHNDDLDALYAMLQKTAEDQPDKVMIGASTPTGRRERFWQWCMSPRFKEFFYPSYVNPFFSKEQEEEFREQYNPSAYRHEIEADWGEDAEGVYPRKMVDQAFIEPSWPYSPEVQSSHSFITIGVDWDKYGAGTNIVAVEVCDENYEDPVFRDKTRVLYREEIPKSEFTLTKAVDRIIELNTLLNPMHIYIDRGYGDVQLELLRKYGQENPRTMLAERVKGISFAESIEIRDPITKLFVKKEIKPYMVNNLRDFLEKGKILFPETDEELYLQLISYVVTKTTSMGRPVFEASGSAMDHAHDALILALLAITQNYGDLSHVQYATSSKAFSNQFFLTSTGQVPSENTEEKNKDNAILVSDRVSPMSSNMTGRLKKKSKISRRMF